MGIHHSTSFGPGADIKTEAWILRRLISIFGQVTRRPHIPRDPQMKHLFTVVGIDVTRSSNEALETNESPGLDFDGNLKFAMPSLMYIVRFIPAVFQSIRFHLFSSRLVCKLFYHTISTTPGDEDETYDEGCDEDAESDDAFSDDEVDEDVKPAEDCVTKK